MSSNNLVLGLHTICASSLLLVPHVIREIDSQWDNLRNVRRRKVHRRSIRTYALITAINHPYALIVTLTILTKMGLEIFVAIVFVIIIVTKLSVLLSKTPCESKVSIVGKVIIVTGSNNGLGFETAKDLAKRGGRVILACRNEGRALAARDRIIKDTGNTDVVYKHLDLASLESVRRFAQDITSTESRLDVLVNNAGVNGCGDRHTADGIVEEMQVNYFGGFLLTLLLLPLLKKTGASRIVNVSSTMHFFGRINFKHINEKGYYWDIWTYANSKLCMVLFTVELARRLRGSGVTVNAVHPGIIKTNIGDTSCATEQFIYSLLCWTASRSAVEGVQTIIYLAVADEVAKTTGKYFIDCKERYMTWRTMNKKLATALWNYSEKLVDYEMESRIQK